MYTVLDLQQRLEKAKDTLREVEDHILKVDGKPSGIQALRYTKQDSRQERDWNAPNHPPNEEGPIRRRVFDSTGDEAPRRRGPFAPFPGQDLQRRRAFGLGPDDGGGRRRVLEGEGPRRRPFSTAEGDSLLRKRTFPAIDDDEEDVYPARKKAFQSVVGKVQLPDLNVALKRGRERRERDKQDDDVRDGAPRPRNVFARLSGLAVAASEQVEDDDDEGERVLKRQPMLSSRVLAIEHPKQSREEVMVSQKQDEARKQRDRRMFGALLGTLQQFRREETQVKEKEERRQKIERKLEDDARREKERLREEKRALQAERLRREADIKRIEWSLNRVKEFAAWEESVLPLKNFIQTKSQPHIFYLPKHHNNKTVEALEASAKTVQEMIDKRLTGLNEEIESSERKASKRADGEAGDINKENEGDLEGVKDEKEAHDEGDGDLDESAWEERNYDADEAEADHEKLTEDRVVPVSDNSDPVDAIRSSDERLPINGGDGQRDTVECEGLISPPEDIPMPPAPSSNHLETGKLTVEMVKSPEMKDLITSKSMSKSPEPRKHTLEAAEKVAVSESKFRSRSRSSSPLRNRSSPKKSRSLSHSKEPTTKSKVTELKSRSSSRKPSGKTSRTQRASPDKRRSRSGSPRQRARRSRSRSKSREGPKKPKDVSKRRSRSVSRKRSSPDAKRQQRSRTRSRSGRKRSRSKSPRRSRSRSPVRRRRHSRSRSRNRRRHSRSSHHRSSRKRSSSLQARSRKRSANSSSPSSSSSSSSSGSD